MNSPEQHVEIDFYQETKHGESVCGDNFKFVRLENENRYIVVLSDGLGSGIKASLLANMTTTMALKFIGCNMDIIQSAETIMDTLPICEFRKISYATFTIVDTCADGFTRVIEMGNPEYIHMRDGKDMVHEKKMLVSANWPDRQVFISEFKILPEDRLIICSDGVTQSGLGTQANKFGWRRKGCYEFAREKVDYHPDLSARDLSKMIVAQARIKNKAQVCTDDTSCAVIYFRTPRKMMLVTGPPFREKDDSSFARLMENFEGRKVICGGTTAQIIARELGRKIKTDWRQYNSGLPPPSKMDGVDMITEGILTLTETARYMESGEKLQTAEIVRQLVEIFHESDIINIVAGTKVNEAHQDPKLPVDLEIRRNIIKRIKVYLETNLLKKVNIQYI